MIDPNHLLLGLGELLTPLNIAWLIAGVFIGLVAGATPGISGTMVVAILLPLTYGLPASTALILMTTTYAVAVFSGSITAVLFRTPGAPEAAVTVLDGYEMTRKGYPEQALGHAVFSSFLGGTIGAIVFLLVCAPLASVALEFGSPEIFGLIAFTMVAVASIGTDGKQIKAILCALFGLFLATIGIDVTTAVPRYTFGIPILFAGIHFIPVVLGLFAVSEALRMVQGSVIGALVMGTTEKVKTILPRLKEIRRLMPVYVRSIPIGIGIGILPGVGATTAAFVSYAQAAKFSKEPEKFGTGIPEGIAAPESANNAAAMGAMVPLLALGIPGSATTAVMLGAVILHGLRPGPLLFETHPQFVYAIMLAAIVANLLIIVVSPLFIRFFARVLQVPRGVLGTLILTLCIVGSFAIRNNIVDVWLVFVFGILGYILEKHKYPIAPIVIGVVLGKLFEEELRRTLIISGGDLTVFFTRPIAAAFIVATLLLLVVPVFGALRRQLQTRKTR